jgi:hypothetical protein
LGFVCFCSFCPFWFVTVFSSLFVLVLLYFVLNFSVSFFFISFLYFFLFLPSLYIFALYFCLAHRNFIMIGFYQNSPVNKYDVDSAALVIFDCQNTNKSHKNKT